MRTIRRDRGHAGEAIAELVVLAPFLIFGIVFFTVAVGRVADGRSQLDGAAAAAARAASLASSSAGVQAAAQSAVSSFLGGHPTTCGNPRASVDTTDFRAGGQVAVNVQCDVDLAAVVAISPVRTVTLHDRVVAPIDTYRQVSP